MLATTMTEIVKESILTREEEKEECQDLNLEEEQPMRRRRSTRLACIKLLEKKIFCVIMFFLLLIAGLDLIKMFTENIDMKMLSNVIMTSVNNTLKFNKDTD